MDRPRPPKVTVNICRRADVESIRRLAGMLPGYSAHRVAVEALRRGLPAMEHELRLAARLIVDEEGV